jgi:hypothetical protein
MVSDDTGGRGAEWAAPRSEGDRLKAAIDRVWAERFE